MKATLIALVCATWIPAPTAGATTTGPLQRLPQWNRDALTTPPRQFQRHRFPGSTTGTIRRQAPNPKRHEEYDAEGYPKPHIRLLKQTSE